MLIGMATTALVVVGVAALVLWYMVTLPELGGPAAPDGMIVV